MINCLAQFSSRLCFIFYRYGDKAPKSKMGRIFSVMATLVGLVSIAVLLGNLTTSLTTDIVFSDIKLYGSKVITINLVFFPEIGKNDMLPSVELLSGTFLQNIAVE